MGVMFATGAVHKRPGRASKMSVERDGAGPASRTAAGAGAPAPETRDASCPFFALFALVCYHSPNSTSPVIRRGVCIGNLS